MSRHSVGWGWMLLVGWALASQAQAQSVRLDRFRSAEKADDGFAVRRMGAFGHQRLGLNLVVDYGNDPLVVERRSASGATRRSVVHNEMVLKADFSWALVDRVLIFAGFDAPLWMAGSAPPPGSAVAAADGAGMGDVSLGGRLRLVGAEDDLFGLGLSAALIVPTSGNSSNYSGEDGVALRPELLLELRPPGVRISGNVGFMIRTDSGSAYRAEVDHELSYGAALGVPVHPRLELIGEWYGGLRLKDANLTDALHMEWLLGAKVSSSYGVYLGAAGGTGFDFARAPGTPDARAVAQLGFLTGGEKKAAPPPPPPPPPPADSDADGIVDDADRCPDQPEDADGFEDEDGCPDLDNDQDGIGDEQDGCPDQAEDMDGFEDTDGCPDEDNDQDGIPDSEDACPDQAGVPEEGGCKAKVQIQASGEITIDEQILFASGRDAILEQSFPILEAVAKLLENHTEVQRVRVEGHTDSRGAAAKNMRLSRRRARAVGVWLMTRGISAERLQAFGCGERHPMADNDTAQGRTFNRRVVFQIVEPPPEDETLRHAPVGCRPIKLGIVKLR